MASSRDRILDAYEALLATEGERYATLDAVAAKAEVSKAASSTTFRPRIASPAHCASAW